MGLSGTQAVGRWSLAKETELRDRQLRLAAGSLVGSGRVRLGRDLRSIPTRNRAGVGTERRRKQRGADVIVSRLARLASRLQTSTTSRGITGCFRQHEGTHQPGLASTRRHQITLDDTTVPELQNPCAGESSQGGAIPVRLRVERKGRDRGVPEAPRVLHDGVARQLCEDPAGHRQRHRAGGVRPALRCTNHRGSPTLRQPSSLSEEGATRGGLRGTDQAGERIDLEVLGD